MTPTADPTSSAGICARHVGELFDDLSNARGALAKGSRQRQKLGERLLARLSGSPGSPAGARHTDAAVQAPAEVIVRPRRPAGKTGRTTARPIFTPPR